MVTKMYFVAKESSDTEMFPADISSTEIKVLKQCPQDENSDEEKVFARPISMSTWERQRSRPWKKTILECLAITGVVGGIALILTPLALVTLPSSVNVAVGIGCLFASSFAVIST